MADTDLLTPEWFLKLVRMVSVDGVIGLDPCTFADNPTRARVWYTKEVDGLTMGWGNLGLVFVNEPYSRATSGPWSDKIAAEAYAGAEIVRLTRASTDTGWWHASVPDFAASVCFLKGRPRHARPGEVATGAGKFASAAVYYGWRAREFERVFAPHGWLVRP